MKKYIKNAVSALLILLMVVQVVAMPISAATVVESDEPSISLDDNAQYTVSGIDASRYENGFTAEELGVYRPEDQVNAIVMLGGDSLLSLAEANHQTAAEFAKSDAGKAAVAAMTAQQDKVIAELGTTISDVKYRYTTLFSGFACTTTYRMLATIESLYAGSSTLIAERYEIEAEATDNALNAYGTGIYNSSETGYTGQGMVVAVLDTGLDYNHSAFQRLPEGKTALSADDIEELYPYLTASTMNDSARWEESYYSQKVVYMYDYADQDSDVYPVNDHGTHVAGIIAGKDDTITGVAIDSQLAIMKVFGNKDEGAPQEAILAALSDAVLLGVDVINMSLGSSCGFSRASDEEGVNEVYDAVRAAGINLIVAASNSHSSAKGSNVGDTNRTSNPDSMTLGSPATYDSSLSIASVLGAKSHYLLANGTEPIYLTKAKNNHGDDIEFYDLLLDGRETAEYEYVLVPGIGNDGNYDSLDVSGKIAIVKRGVNTFEEKVRTAEAHGAVGVIVYNNVSGVISMTIGTATLPTCSISMDAGVYFTSNPTGKIVLSADNLAGPFMSDFSSWGPNSDLVLNPDVTSYGGDITSAVRGGYDVFSGTSMACPNLAGSAALVRQYVKEQYPTLTADERSALVNQLLMSTASILRNEAGNPYSPRKQGAGLADAERAVHTGAYLTVDGSDKSKLSLGDDPGKTGVYTLTFHVKNVSNRALSYALSTLVMTETVSSDGKTVAEQAYMLSSASSYAVSGGNLSGNVLTVPGYGDATLTVTVTLTDADRAYLDANFANGMYVEGFVTLECLDGDCDLTMPYLAFYGDWTAAPLLDVTAFEEGKEAKDPSILEDEKLKADVYATIPMVGFYSGSELTYYYMGKPMFILADGYEAPPVLEEYCALSTSKDGLFQLRMISAGLLRNAKSVYMTITDAVSGEVIFERTSENCRKSYYSGNQTGGYVEVEFDASEAGLANNTKYTFTMTCELDWEGEQHNTNNTFSFSFYIDDESPVLDRDQTVLRVEKDKNGNITGYYLDMYVYDNRYLSGFFLSTFDSIDASGKAVNAENVIDGYIPVDDMTGSTTNKVTINLTSIWHKLVDGAQPGSKNLQITLYDYAKNSSVVNLTLSKTAAETVNFKNGRKNTANGDTISFVLAPNKQLNLKSTDYLVTTPTDIYTEDLVWTSSDDTIATVVDGMVTARSHGTCTITATSPTTGATASITINCTGNPASEILPVSSLTLNSTYIVLERGEAFDLYVTVAPYNVTNQPELTWSTSSPYVTLTPDPEDPTHCTVFAAKSGSATVTVKANGTLFSASCRVGIAEEYETTGAYLQSYTGRGDENGVVEIPDDKGITIINRLAFLNNKYITKVIIPEGVEEIQYAAFYGCENLREVVLPSTCTKIDEWAFGHNPALETINLEHVTTIYQLAFYGDESLREVDLSSCLTICDRAFSFCSSLTSVDISNVGQIGRFCFVYCTALEELITSPINKIADYAFTGCSSLRKLDLYATYVGEFAFYRCSALTDVTFYSDVSEIDSAAFYYASALSNLSFRGKVKYIGDFAFANCSRLTSIYIPAGCEYLGTYAFGAASNATSITFSADANIRSVGQNPFYLVPYVTAFSVESGSKYLRVEDGILYDKDMTTLLLVPYAKSVNYLSVPETVTTIGDYAFSSVYTVGTVRLNNVTTIGTGAFASSAVQMIVPTQTLREIGDYAFASCSKLTAFALNDGLRSIGAHAFSDDAGIAWGDLTFPASLKTVGDYAFEDNTGMTSVTVPAAWETVSEGVFSGCRGLTSVTLEEGITAIGKYAFIDAQRLTAVTVPDSVTTMDEGAFAGCVSLTDVTLSANLESIPAYTFYAASALSDMILPDGITAIGDFAFYGAAALATVDLNQVAEIGAHAFVGTALTTLDAAQVTAVGDYAFAGTSLTTVSLPAAETIGMYAFFNTQELASVSMDSVREIGEAAFYRAMKLTSVNLPNCEILGDAAFYHDALLESVTLPCVKEIGSYAFYHTKVTSLDLPATLEKVAPNAFTIKAFSSDDDSLPRFETLTLEEGCEKFFLDGEGVLYRRLTDTTYELVAYPAGKTATSYTVLDGTVRIAAYAFSTNNSLESVTIARTVKYIGSGAFYGCTSLVAVSFLSVTPTTLESEYSSASKDGWTYNNLVSEVGEMGSPVGIEITVPKNAVGYDSYLWSRYIGSTVSSGVISMTDSTAYLVAYINALPDTVTLADADTVDYLQKVYTATDSDQRTFVTNYAKLASAISEVARLRSEAGSDDPVTPPAEPQEPVSPETPEHTSVWIVIVAVVAVVAIAGAVTAVIVVRKKKGGTNQ